MLSCSKLLQINRFPCIFAIAAMFAPAHLLPSASCRHHAKYAQPAERLHNAHSNSRCTEQLHYPLHTCPGQDLPLGGCDASGPSNKSLDPDLPRPSSSKSDTPPGEAPTSQPKLLPPDDMALVLQQKLVKGPPSQRVFLQHHDIEAISMDTGATTLLHCILFHPSLGHTMHNMTAGACFTRLL